MKSCCSDLTVKMQEQVELGKWLKLFIAASPFVLLLPDLTPGGSAREVAGSIAEKMAKDCISNPQLKRRSVMDILLWSRVLSFGSSGMGSFSRLFLLEEKMK